MLSPHLISLGGVILVPMFCPHAIRTFVCTCSIRPTILRAIRPGLPGASIPLPTGVIHSIRLIKLVLLYIEMKYIITVLMRQDKMAHVVVLHCYHCNLDTFFLVMKVHVVVNINYRMQRCELIMLYISPANPY